MRYLSFLIFSFLYLFGDGHIFVYHRFDDSRYSSANTSTQKLIKQFEYLKQHNYKVVPIQQMINHLKSNQPIPQNWVALTIDDGYKSFFKNGLKIFKQYNYPFSLYVYVKATNKHYGDYMSWEELKETAKYGTIGLHSYSHPKLPHLTKQQIIKDTSKGIKIFKQHLGFKPKIYAYPYGEYNQKVQNILVENFNFEAILNQNIGSISKDTNQYDIPRIALVGKVNIKQKLRYKTFKAKILQPASYPKDGILKKVVAKTNKKYKTLSLYITGYGWRKVKLKDGIVDIKLNLKLKKDRIRIIIGKDIYNIFTKLITKGE